MCYNCGEAGHPAKDCTKPTKGKVKGRSNGKGVRQVDGEDEDGAWNQPDEEDQNGIDTVDTEEEWRPVSTKRSTLGQFAPEVLSIDKTWRRLLSVRYERMGKDKSANRCWSC